MEQAWELRKDSRCGGRLSWCSGFAWPGEKRGDYKVPMWSWLTSPQAFQLDLLQKGVSLGGNQVPYVGDPVFGGD